MSPLYPHGFELPTTYSENAEGPDSGKKAFSLEGLWEGLKSYTLDEKIDYSKFTIQNQKISQRFPASQLLGFHSGVHPNAAVISIVEAKAKIFLPLYRDLLDLFCAEEIAELRSLIQEGKRLIFVDKHITSDLDSDSPAICSAYLIVKYLENEYPEVVHKRKHHED